MNKVQIPQTDSIIELAHFWDTHDLSEFADQLEEVREPGLRARSHSNYPFTPRQGSGSQKDGRIKGRG